MTTQMDPEFLVPTEEENAYLESLEPTYTTYSEMTVAERQFLNSMVLRARPRKILEVGMSSGASAVIMLNATRNVPGARLHTIDLMDQYYYDDTKKVGFVLDGYDDLSSRCTRYSGDLAMEFMEEIGGDIDLVFIDTAHQNPGEILDTLMVLPYLRDDAIIVYHDVNLHAIRNRMGVSFAKSYTNNLLMSTIYGSKVTQGKWIWSDTARTPFPNIGAIRTNQATRDHIWEIVNLLSIKWSYIPSQEHEDAFVSFIDRHYGSYFAGHVAFTFRYQRSIAGRGIGKATKKLVKRVVGPKGMKSIVKLVSRTKA